MPDASYVAIALAVGVAITVALRAIPFAMKSALKDSALLADLGHWMPLGAVAILAGYCLSRIDPAAPAHGIPQVVGLVVTIAVHRWRRNTVLSLVAGTAACVLLANGLLPGVG